MTSRSAEQLAEVHDLRALVLEKQKAAMALRDLDLFNDCLSRAYYSAFHAVTLLFFLRGQAFDSHKQLLGQFNKLFVHGGSFPPLHGSEPGNPVQLPSERRR